MQAQEYRTYDGKDNNLGNPEWGAVHGPLSNLTSITFADGYQIPTGLTRPNARLISNQLFLQSGTLPDPSELSDYVWVFGQFLDHDIILVEDEPREPLVIKVPSGDEFFDPFSSGEAFIPMTRNIIRSGTGTGPDNPRKYENEITAFIDGSVIYGSSEEQAFWLRTFQQGKLKMSAGLLLPFNTTNAQYTGEIDDEAPFMANLNRATTRFFVAGDVRANENVLLVAMHTLFAREHNRLCDSLVQVHPEWTDEQLFQHTRKLIGGLIQAITYNEWLPVMGVHLPEYEGYKTDVDPSISNVFSAAAFRFGHTLLNSTLLRLDADGQPIPEGNLSLKEAFFEPTEILLGRGLDPLFRGMGAQMMQTYDCRVIEDVRSFLFGRPGQGGLDLVAINIMRGRERGLADFNTIREDLGLPVKPTFARICPIPSDAQKMEDLYGSVYNIDPWVGMLAESRMPNSFLGETAMEIVSRQFQALRDGDRFFYENDPDLSPEEVDWLNQQTLAKVVLRNSKLTRLQNDVFIAQSPDLTTSTNNQNESSATSFMVFPNPTTGRLLLNIEMERHEPVSLNLFDASGRLLSSQQLNLHIGVNTMDYFIDQPTGIYVLQIHTRTGVVSQRIAKL